MNRYKLFVADIDGTLVNNKRELLPLMKEVLEIFHRNNILVCLSSGRPFFQIKPLEEEWGLDFPFDAMIGLNGAELYDHETNKTYQYDLLKEDVIKEIVELMTPYKAGNCFIYKDDKMYTMHIDEQMRDSAYRHKMGVELAPNIEFFYGKQNAKILFRFETKEALDEVVNQLNIPEDASYYYFRTQPTMLEFADKKTNKAHALIELCKKRGIDLKDVIAAGDMTNDNEMLKVAGLGICLKNGSEDTKASADVVTELDHEHDGLAYYLIENIIQPLGLK